MHFQASRAGGRSEQASIAPSISSWLQKLPTEVSGYSSTDPSSLTRPHAPSGPHPNVAPQTSPLRPARPSRAADARRAPQPAIAESSQRGLVAQFDAWNDLETVGHESSISQRSSNWQASSTHQMFSVRQMPPAHQTPSVCQKATLQQTLTVYQDPRMQQFPTMQQCTMMPRFAVANVQTPVVNNYSPVDNRRDTINQSMETLQINSNSGPRDQQASAPSESIPLRRPIMKCKRGLFFHKGITTHQHVPDNRPC